jgi:hypothetical protein
LKRALVKVIQALCKLKRALAKVIRELCKLKCPFLK